MSSSCRSLIAIYSSTRFWHICSPPADASRSCIVLASFLPQGSRGTLLQILEALPSCSAYLLTTKRSVVNLQAENQPTAMKYVVDFQSEESASCQNQAVNLRGKKLTENRKWLVSFWIERQLAVWKDVTASQDKKTILSSRTVYCVFANKPRGCPLDIIYILDAGRVWRPQPMPTPDTAYTLF